MRAGLRPYFFIAALAALVYIPFLGQVHLFDWDEVNFAESAREMLITGEYFQVQVNFMPFWEKPPLFIWMQAASMSVFGVNEFAARFPNALCGILTLLILFYYGKKFFTERVGWLWVLAYAGSLTPQLYFKTGIIDPWFNLFIFLGVVQAAIASLHDRKLRKRHFFYSGIFIGLALLTKGPVAVIVFALCIAVVLVFRSFRFYFDWLDVLLFSLSTLLVSSLWYGVEWYRHGIWFFEEFIRYQKELASQSVASHGQPWYYHPLVLLFGVFPASIIALRAFTEKMTWTDEERNIRVWMTVLFWVVLILFSMVKTKIIHYSSLCYLPLTFLAALAMENTLNVRIQYRRSNAVTVGVIGVIFGLAFLFLPLLGQQQEWMDSLIAVTQDPFAAANLALDVSWPWYTLVPGVVWLAGLLYSVNRLWHKKLKTGYPALFLSAALGMQLFLLLVIPRVERYTQGAAIEFLEQFRNEDVYVETLGYKSYAQYFYTDMQPVGDTASLHRYERETAERYAGSPSRDIPGMQFKDWLVHGEIDKPAYFISKIQMEEVFSGIETLEVIGRKGGFVFYKRINGPGSSAPHE